MKKKNVAGDFITACKEDFYRLSGNSKFQNIDVDIKGLMTW